MRAAPGRRSRERAAGATRSRARRRAPATANRAEPNLCSLGLDEDATQEASGLPGQRVVRERGGPRARGFFSTCSSTTSRAGKTARQGRPSASTAASDPPLAIAPPRCGSPGHQSRNRRSSNRRAERTSRTPTSRSARRGPPPLARDHFACGREGPRRPGELVDGLSPCVSSRKSDERAPR